MDTKNVVKAGIRKEANKKAGQAGQAKKANRSEPEKSVLDLSEESAEMWADREFGCARLGDRRRTQRLVKTVAGKAKNTEAAMSLCCERNDAQAISRLLANPVVTVESTTEPHRQRTAERCREYPTVYVVQDTTTLNYTGHKDLEGIGPICQHDWAQGLIMHAGAAVSPDGTMLGLTSLNLWARSKEKRKKGKNLDYFNIEDKESFKWIQGKLDAEEALGDSCRVVLVGDRESDVFELFAQKRGPLFELLVRAQHNRCVTTVKGEEGKLFDLMDAAPSLGEYVLHIPRSGGRAARDALIEVRAGKVVITPHNKLKQKGYDKALTVNWVRAFEKNSPVKEPIDWKLLTTAPVDDYAKAKTCVDGYSKRWVIEEFFKTLKSGCKAEKLQFETLGSMLPAIAICCVVAWRVVFLTKYARENPEGDAALVSTKLERTVLQGALKSLKKVKKWRVKSVKDFVVGVARLGGYLGRKNDGPPGMKSLWTGLRRLDDLVKGYLLAREIQESSDD